MQSSFYLLAALLCSLCMELSASMQRASDGHHHLAESLIN